MQPAVIILQTEPHIHALGLLIVDQNTLLHSETSLHFEFRQFSGIIYKVCFEVKSPCLSVYSGDISVLKFGQNQRKPGVFKASELLSYYNSIIDSSYNTCCFHRLSPYPYKYDVLNLVLDEIKVLVLVLADFWKI